MANEIKFTDDEMKEISEMQKTYMGIQNAYGQLGMNRLRMEKDIENLRLAEENITKSFEETQQKEKDFVTSITKKYGDGNLNLETGTFTPRSKNQDKTDKK
jgi:hypothetical protein